MPCGRIWPSSALWLRKGAGALAWELICINGWQRAVRQTYKVYSYRVENHFPLLA